MTKAIILGALAVIVAFAIACGGSAAPPPPTPTATPTPAPTVHPAVANTPNVLTVVLYYGRSMVGARVTTLADAPIIDTDDLTVTLRTTDDARVEWTNEVPVESNVTTRLQGGDPRITGFRKVATLLADIHSWGIRYDCEMNEERSGPSTRVYHCSYAQ